jgi:hypothetical protein
MLISDAKIALSSNYDVVIDGFYRLEISPNYLDELLVLNEYAIFMFYFDISLEETIRRHSKRQKFKEYGEDKLRDWYYPPKPNEVHDFEYRIPETNTLEQTLQFIKETIEQL